MAVLGIDIGGTKVAVRLRTGTTDRTGDRTRGADGDPTYRDGGRGLDPGLSRGVDEVDEDVEFAAAVDVDLVRRWSAGAGAADDVAMLGSLVEQARARADAAGAPVEAAGVAVAATLSAQGTVTAWPSRASWVGLDLGGELGAMLGVPFRTGDDGTLAALAEAWDAGCADFAYLGVGTGVGGGLVLGGRLHAGAHGGAGELGHLVVNPAGPRCVCGRRGCLQAIASGPATIARAAAASREDAGSGAAGSGAARTGAAGSGDARTGDARAAAAAPEEFVAAVRRGDDVALGALREGADALALAVVALAETVQPAQVRIGGGFAAAVPELVPMVVAALRPLRRRGHRLPEVAPATFGPSSSLEGAILLARQDIHGYRFVQITA
jgi:kanosamine 6-kinase